jgi:hypothetical protein
VKPDVEISFTVPIDPPVAGPDRTLDPPLPAPRNAAGAIAALAVGLLPNVALTIPYAPPATAAAARPAAMKQAPRRYAASLCRAACAGRGGGELVLTALPVIVRARCGLASTV